MGKLWEVHGNPPPKTEMETNRKSGGYEQLIGERVEDFEF